MHHPYEVSNFIHFPKEETKVQRTYPNPYNFINSRPAIWIQRHLLPKWDYSKLGPRLWLFWACLGFLMAFLGSGLAFPPLIHPPSSHPTVSLLSPPGSSWTKAELPDLVVASGTWCWYNFSWGDRKKHLFTHIRCQQAKGTIPFMSSFVGQWVYWVHPQKQGWAVIGLGVTLK